MKSQFGNSLRIGEPAEVYPKEELLKIADSMNIQYWYNIDIDKNGLTDLIFQSTGHLEAVLVFQENNYKRFRISKPRAPGEIGYYPEIITLNKQPLLIVKKKYGKLTDTFGKQGEYKIFYIYNQPLVVDTLIYKFRGFIEFNPHYKKGVIDSVRIETTGCFGTCPVFEISIKKGNCILNAKEYVNDGKLNGNYFAKLNAIDQNDIEGILSYINPDKLKSAYYYNQDFPSAKLYFAINKKFYSVYDNGLQGNYALKQLFELVYNIVLNSNWKNG